MESTAVHFLILTVAGWISRRQGDAIEYLLEENPVLREHFGGRRLRFSDAQRRRLAQKGERLDRKRLAALASIVTPDTILRWYRKLIAQKYDGSSKRGAGRPRVKESIRQLVLRVARENPRWGYTRIVGALRNLDRTVSRSTVKRLLAEEGILPAPERGERTPWNTFLRAHWEGIAAADFFTVEVLSVAGLVRYHVFFVIELASRRVHLAGVVHEPGERWIMQVARNLTDDVDGFLSGKRFLILDRDPLLRNHQGLDNDLIDSRAGPANDNGEVHRRQRLGGLLSFYERRAA